VQKSGHGADIGVCDVTIASRDIAAPQIFAATGLTMLSMAVIWMLLSMLGPDWSIYAPATCTTTRCFCEMPRADALIVQPANSWSSYGHALAGFLMIVLSRSRSWASGFSRDGAMAFGLSTIFVGLGSVLLHATLTLWGQFFDVMGMYLTSGFMFVSAMTRWRDLSARSAVLLYIAVVGGLLVVLYLVPEVRRSLFAVVLIAAIALELICARPRRTGIRVSYYFAAIATKAVAFAIWNLDQHGLVCRPESLIQGHAIWHLLGAVSLWLTFLYYRSERAT
jgi:Ceramidase